MKVGLAADHGGFDLKETLLKQVAAEGHDVVDFGAFQNDPSDDYPDFVTPLARAVAAKAIDRGIAVCGSGVGASICANKVPSVRAAVVHDHYSAAQGVEHDEMNVLCLGARVVGPAVAWDLVQAFLQARFTAEARHQRRMGKVAALEAEFGGGASAG